MKKLDTFLYLDNRQMKMYLDQLPESIQKHIKAKFTFGLSLAGPKLDATVEKEKKALNLYEQLVTLEEIFKINKSVTTRRPKSMKAATDKPYTFVHETTTATKLIFPKNKIEQLNGIKHLAIWISEPNPKHLGDENKWEYTGTFLYLLESIGDYGEYQSVISGVSALLVLCNIVLGHDFFDTLLNKADEETFGRWNYIHPIEKLKTIGAIPTEKRKIETLYRCRYITNEQSYTYKNEKYRVSDLLAYPIYIKEA
jgi:hypothetical protein